MKITRNRFLVAAVCVAALLRLWRIGAQSLWVDEVMTFVASNPKPGLHIWDYAKYNIHGPLLSVVIWLIRFVTTHDAWLRLPSAVAGTVAVYFFFRWVELWMNERVARLATVLFVVHPLHIFYSQELRNYSFLMCFALAACFYFHRLLNKETLRRFIPYGLAMLAAALSNLGSVFLYVAHTVLFLWRHGPLHRRLVRWAMVAMLLAIALSPWIYRVYRFVDVSKLVVPVKVGEIAAQDRLRGETTITPAVIPYTLYAFSVGFTLGPSMRELHIDSNMAIVLARHRIVISWVALLFGWGIVAGLVQLRRARYPAAQLALYLLTPILFTVFMCWQNTKAYNVRYVLLALPAYLCLLAVGVEAMGRARWVLHSLLIGTMLVSLYNLYYDGRYAREDVRAAARFVAERASRDDCIVAPTVTEVFTHYYKPRNPVFPLTAPAGTPHALVDAQLARVFANCDRLWYVRAREWVDDGDGYTLTQLTTRYHEVQRIEFNGVALYRFTR